MKKIKSPFKIGSKNLINDDIYFIAEIGHNHQVKSIKLKKCFL